MFKAAGASVSSMPSNEVYVGMQTGVMDAACTSSSSFLSFKLQEACKHMTTPGNRSFFFILEPIMVSKAIWDTLTKAQQDAMMAVGEEMIPFNLAGAKFDDLELSRVFGEAGVAVHPHVRRHRRPLADGRSRQFLEAVRRKDAARRQDAQARRSRPVRVNAQRPRARRCS